MDKILYMDGDKPRLLKGQITAEDEFFITLQLDDSTYKIGKRSIISVRQGKDNERENF